MSTQATQATTPTTTQAATQANTQAAAADRLAFADGLRAIAVMWVVLHHLYHGGHIARLVEHLPAFVIRVMEYGYLGVTIFFVLSGYVMALTTHALDVDGRVAGRFLLRRLLRLTPPLYLSIAVGVALAWIEAILRPQTAQLPSPAAVIAHLFYAQDFLGYPPINVVYWTLIVEIQFYVAFALMAWAGDALRRATGWPWARIAALVAMPWALRFASTPLWPGGFIGFWYGFMLGVFVCWWARREPGAGWGLWALMAVVAVGIAREPQANGVVSLLTAGALALAHRANAMQRWLNIGWVQWIGLISYSVYLFHVSVQGVSAYALRRVLAPSVATDIVIGVVLIVAPLLASWVAYRLIELPSIAWSRRIRLRPAAPAPAHVVPARAGQEA
jgi:peptidoglycan/LPS O-acetylase OafA/YrhL